MPSPEPASPPSWWTRRIDSLVLSTFGAALRLAVALLRGLRRS